MFASKNRGAVAQINHMKILAMFEKRCRAGLVPFRSNVMFVEKSAVAQDGTSSRHKKRGAVAQQATKTQNKSAVSGGSSLTYTKKV